MPTTTAAKKQVTAAILTSPEFAELEIDEVTALVDVLEKVIGPFSSNGTPSNEDYGYYGIVTLAQARDDAFATEFVAALGNEMFVKVGSLSTGTVNKFRARYNYRSRLAGRKIKTNRYGPLYHVQVVS